MSLLCVLSIYRCYFLGMSCEALLLYLLYQCSDGYSLPFLLCIYHDKASSQPLPRYKTPFPPCDDDNNDNDAKFHLC